MSTPSVLRGRKPLAAALTLLAVGTVVVLTGTLVAVAGSKVSPATTVDSPTESDVVSGDLTVIGSAEHPVGVATVELVVRDLSGNRYWNGESWQSAFIRFPVAVSPSGGTDVQWTYTVPAEALSRGDYRVRGFARSVEGNGDANGGDAADVRYVPGLDTGLYDTEIVAPADGATVSGEVRLDGEAASRAGVAAVLVLVRNLDTGLYWNAGTGTWTESFHRSSADLSTPDAEAVTWSLTVPAPSADAGEYRTRAWVRTSDGDGDPFGRGRSTFNVTRSSTPAPAPVPTTTVTTTAPTTSVPVTAGPTTAAPTTTVAPDPAPAPTITVPVPTTTAAPAPTTTEAPPPPTPAPRPTPAPGCEDGEPGLLIPCSGIIFGSTGDFTTADGTVQPKVTDFRRTEARLGTDFDLYHDFLQWNDLVDKTFPRADVQELVDEGRLLLTNWKSPTGHPRDWARIANGDYDDDIVVAARQMAAFGEPTFLTFFHEPEDNIRDVSDGNQALVDRYVNDYAAAFRHLHDVFDANGADNVVWVWDMQGWIGGWESYYTGGLYPGDDVVDWVAWNPYNWHACENHGSEDRWRSWPEVVSSFYDWVDEGGPDRPSRDKPLMLGEFGSEENIGSSTSDQTKAEWIAEIGEVVEERFPRLKALVYFNTEGKRPDGSIQFCEWPLDSSPSAERAMANLLTDPSLTLRWD